MRTWCSRSPEHAWTLFFSDTLVQAEIKRVDVPYLMTRCSADRAVFNRYEDELINWSHITAEQEAELYSKEEFDLT